MIDGQQRLGAGLVIGGGALAIAATPVANKVYRSQYSAFRQVADQVGPMFDVGLDARIAVFDRSIGKPIVWGRNLAIGLGVAAAIGGVGLLAHSFLDGDH